ncbi:hypothetical protein HanRHA438_Chr09g0421731 [Helianthus annuus]|nr:hypothetical protein HanRHA438_Chr09g0421731 [Helianthus annuus]
MPLRLPDPTSAVLISAKHSPPYGPNRNIADPFEARALLIFPVNPLLTTFQLHETRERVDLP